MKRYLSIVILLLLILGINIFFRLGTAYLPFTKTLAKNSVIADLYKDARKQIDDEFKDFPPEAKAKVAEDLVKIWKKERKESINESIKQKIKEFKSEYQDEQGHTFLMELDPYHWFRLIRNLITKGALGDMTIDNTQYDSFMLAPIGMKVEPTLHKNLHVLLGYYAFKIARIFNKDISLMHFLFYVPIVISSIAIVVLFFFSLNISKTKSGISIFLASITLGLAPIFLSRSVAGWFDTDSYVILFSVLSAWTFYLSLRGNISLSLRLSFSCISGLSIGLFSFTWDGWWYIFDLIIIASLYYILNLYLVSKDTKKKFNLNIPSAPFILFILFSLIFVSLCSGFKIMPHFITEPMRVLFAKGYLQRQFWPNTFLTVQELRASDVIEVLNNIGIGFILFLGIAYLLVILYDKKSKDYLHRQFIGFLFAFWILIMTYVSVRTVRFSLLLLVPLSISFGLFLEWLIESLVNTINRLKKVYRLKEVLSVVFSTIFLFIFFNHAIPIRNSTPLINKNWWSVLNKIKADTPKDAIINSWWDYGHWFKAISGRPVIFDGATQNTPMAYWMGRVFLTDNEKEAYGILRMLNSGSNQAFEELEKLGIDKSKCIEILNEIILLKHKDADSSLSKYITDKKERDKILGFTHNPAVAYFIVEPSLIYKMRPISFLGGWDFKRADIYQKFKELKKEEFMDYLIKKYEYSKDDALKLYTKLLFLNTKDAVNWISPSYSYYQESSDFRKEANTLFFDNGFVVDLDRRSVYFDDKSMRKWTIPKSTFYLEGNVFEGTNSKDSDSDFQVLVIQDKDNYRLISLDAKLVDSLLTRLYYLNGRGLKFFKPYLSEELKEKRGRILVYKIEWAE